MYTCPELCAQQKAPPSPRPTLQLPPGTLQGQQDEVGNRGEEAQGGVQSGRRRTTAIHDSEAWRGTGGTGGNTAAVVLLKVSKTSFCKSSHLYLKDPISGPTCGAAVAVRAVHNCAQCVSAPVRLRWAQWPLSPSRIKSSLGLNPYPPRDWGEQVVRRGPIGTPGRAARRMHFASTEGTCGAAIPAPALQRPPHRGVSVLLLVPRSLAGKSLCVS
jgi:hypothetical protein